MIRIGLFKAHVILYCDLDNISVTDFFGKLSRVFLWVFSDLCDPFLPLLMCLSWSELEVFSVEILRPFWVTFWKLQVLGLRVFVFLLKWSHFPGGWMLKSKIIQSYDNMRQSSGQRKEWGETVCVGGGRWSSEARPVLTHTGRESKASLLEPRTAFEWVAAAIPSSLVSHCISKGITWHWASVSSSIKAKGLPRWWVKMLPTFKFRYQGWMLKFSE